MSAQPLVQPVAGLKPHIAANGVPFKTLGQGRPLLLVHGSAGSWNHWRRNIESFAQSHHVIVPDLPGYGDSINVPADISLDAYVDLVEAAALEALAHTPNFDVVAFSFGGLIGASLTARLCARVRRCVLLAPSGFPKPVNRPLGRRPRSTFPDGEAGEGEYLRHNLLAMMLSDPASIDQETMELHRWNMARSRFDNRGLSQGNQLPGILRRIRCPLLVAYGAKDRTPTPSAEARIEICRSVVPALQSEIIPNAGHWLQFEQPALANNMINKFLRG